MNTRERNLLLLILAMVGIFAHVWGAKLYLSKKDEKEQKITNLEIQVNSYRNSAATAEEIKGEMEWLEKHQPVSTTYEKAQSTLEQFLTNSSSSLGFKADNPKLIRIEDEGGKFRRVKIQISATAQEEQLYRWLVEIHQPTLFRAVTQIRMKPTSKDDGTIRCTLTAEKWLIDSEKVNSEEDTEV